MKNLKGLFSHNPEESEGSSCMKHYKYIKQYKMTHVVATFFTVAPYNLHLL